MSIVKVALLLFYIGISLVSAQPGYYEAQQKHIGVVWDVHVEKRAQVDNLPTYNGIYDWRYRLSLGLSTSKSDMAESQYMIDEESEKDFRLRIFNKEHNTMHSFEWFLPAQKKFGCAIRDGTHLCVLMPELYFASFFEARGTPGSKCDKGYSNNDGLCSLSKKGA
ncbi:hypothetical protein CAEBREN_13827 [Caenorhabditis brenneri]|uniref:Secreted protein n=1 Tax=Caenorhabditis brenneri TaxID=135651 RepID=G0MCR1_CAEBE|nr:hypothetical protein CAEBREN_13827 [Caenorhabditis brenneri]